VDDKIEEPRLEGFCQRLQPLARLSHPL
jgi:hypothetical protein